MLRDVCQMDKDPQDALQVVAVFVHAFEDDTNTDNRFLAFEYTPCKLTTSVVYYHSRLSKGPDF
jgi:hypothetical protein